MKGTFQIQLKPYFIIFEMLPFAKIKKKIEDTSFNYFK